MIKLDLGVATYVPLQGSSYLKLPQTLEDKKAILNTQNEDETFLFWSVLAALHSPGREKKPSLCHHYKPFRQQLNVSGIDFPMKVTDIQKFERQNPTLSINVFGYEENDRFPVYISEGKKEEHVNLLLVLNKDNELLLD